MLCIRISSKEYFRRLIDPDQVGAAETGLPAGWHSIYTPMYATSAVAGAAMQQVIAAAAAAAAAAATAAIKCSDAPILTKGYAVPCSLFATPQLPMQVI
jgi:hypothetical protein